MRLGRGLVVLESAAPVVFMMRFIKLMLMLVAGFFVVSVVRMVMDGFKKGLTSDARVPTSRDASTAHPPRHGGRSA